VHVIGIDPGPMVGAVLLYASTRMRLCGPEIAQLTPGSVELLLDQWYATFAVSALAAERFVVGPRAGRSRTPEGGAAARTVLANLRTWTERHGVEYVERSAAEVKPWATDERLEHAGLLELTNGMRHARDGARHALFCAVKSYGLPDPLSRKAGAR
jgi:hypothetical protein